ncbi:hypothetical protein EDI_190600 [Entamoeba dispar SAW760]|uniref:Uncharacterized protein n=1 Tax=Entamoeba dispar (strain ATCC PRA-260 / SAW760) TaxID=370354 RepID=B0E628_ENTDS|nr:uncharacterized protein EDI_190600 [Entamoeba dispar SAW760]EDR30001.1 hypothetical protein EDI_190600 [Entamoeba dispar SAW760]|eukprot:EDR30001.1 hypothetical protein EDI_190600 [Entamoeba dispar SAW760]
MQPTIRHECNVAEHPAFKCLYSFREIRNYQSEQESVLLALLNKFYDITFTAHKKQSLVTVPFFRILTLDGPVDSIQFKELIERRITERLNAEVANGSSLKTALRRCENYRIVDSLHILTDILEVLGYNFSTHLSTGKKGTLKAESICGITSLTGNFLFNQEGISHLGTEVSKYIVGLESIDGICTLHRNDPVIQSLLLPKLK